MVSKAADKSSNTKREELSPLSDQLYMLTGTVAKLWT